MCAPCGWRIKAVYKQGGERERTTANGTVQLWWEVNLGRRLRCEIACRSRVSFSLHNRGRNAEGNGKKRTRKRTLAPARDERTGTGDGSEREERGGSRAGKQRKPQRRRRPEHARARQPRRGTRRHRRGPSQQTHTHRQPPRTAGPAPTPTQTTPTPPPPVSSAHLWQQYGNWRQLGPTLRETRIRFVLGLPYVRVEPPDQARPLPTRRRHLMRHAAAVEEDHAGCRSREGSRHASRTAAARLRLPSGRRAARRRRSPTTAHRGA